MAQKANKTSVQLSKIEGILGVTDDLDMASGYTVLGGLATLTSQVHEMNRMLASLLDKEKATPSPHGESDVENSPHVVTPPRGKSPFPQGVLLRLSWEGWAERVHCLWLARAVILGGWCVKRHTRSSCLFKEYKAVQGEDRQRFLLKRCASWDAPLGENTCLFTC
ncbi:hypothetical protein Cgig2_001651 [Carnegiea gigantea]|uniref:Uncharacterized protein n=1 Tax=Carnegiea gigantea TaxID=171969 RepID=A0A9Q1JRL3_9CARY|nr:hypothetical protein Cgig2_001651 [Carnegiea gigantea]